MEGSIKIKQFIALLRKRILLILSLSFGSAILSGLYAVYMMNPIYEASTQIVVNKKGADIHYDYNSVMTNFQFVNTYSDIIYTPVVIEKVIDDLKLKISYEKLIDQVQVTSTKESQVISISVKDSNYSEAVNIANEIAKVFKLEVDDTMGLNNVIILSPAVEKDSPIPINPHPIVFMIVALIGGFIIGLAIAFLLEIMKNTISTEQDIEEILNIPVIGIVPIVLPQDLKATNTMIKESEILSRKHTQSKEIGGNVS